MKTLNEVIKAYEICLNINEMSCHDCPYTEFDAEGKWACSLCGDCTEDTLHYLKMYHELAKDSELFAEWKENPPLTWDELRLMEGKPVWIEGPFITEGPHWIIVGPSHLYNGKIVGYGKTWQAYRKERS